MPPYVLTAGLGESLRSELLPHGIDVHVYYPTTVLSPGLEQENKTKPVVTKKIEGTAAALTPEQCATYVMRGLQRGHFFITDGVIGRFLRLAASGSAPGNGLLPWEIAEGVVARIGLLAWRRFDADRTVREYGNSKQPAL